MEEPGSQPPSPGGPLAADSLSPGLRALPKRLSASIGRVRRDLTFRLACYAATFRAPQWWVRLRERAAARRDRLAWWWEGYQLHTLTPRLRAFNRRARDSWEWCREAAYRIATGCSRRTAPLRTWWAHRAAAAARRSADLGERLTAFRASHLDPALHASAARLPHNVDGHRVKEGLIVLRSEWEKTVLGACLILATGIIWWNWRSPSPPPPSASELSIVRSFTAHAPKRFDFSKLVNTPRQPPK